MNYKTIFFSVIIALSTIGYGGSAVHAAADEVAPPAADETLIYMIRIGRFVGGGVGVWIGLNDKTVARLRNKKYAVVRAKAGTNTLNLASQGVVVGSMPVDNRPGETVYLTWRLGNQEIAEVDEEEGKKLLRKYKPMKPIKTEKPNDEEIAALINMGRMGFDLMQPATQQLEPDDENAVITFFRHKEIDHLNLGIWSEDRYLGDLDDNQGLQTKVPAGEHYFLAGNVGTSVMRAQVEAGKRYLAWLNLGGFILRVKLTPIENSATNDSGEKLNKVAMVELNSELVTLGIRERESKISEFMTEVIERAKAGEADFTSLDNAHAY